MMKIFYSFQRFDVTLNKCAKCVAIWLHWSIAQAQSQSVYNLIDSMRCAIQNIQNIAHKTHFELSFHHMQLAQMAK